MLSIEAPLHLYEYRSLNEVGFNWTMTYRLDSDFPIPYAWIERVIQIGIIAFLNKYFFSSNLRIGASPAGPGGLGKAPEVYPRLRPPCGQTGK